MFNITSIFSKIAVLTIISAAFIAMCSYAQDDEFKDKRQQMIERQLKARGIKDPLVLSAMQKVKRHLFVPDDLADFAYKDSPLPIGYDQTISQPYIVAYMTEALKLKPGDRVLEIGTGSGYQAAVLAELVEEVYSIEIIEALAKQAQDKLSDLGYDNVRVKYGDGYKGWKEFAPYDAIIVTAAPPSIPKELAKQLKTGGRMIVPAGSAYQQLILIIKTERGYEEEALLPVRFVPMVHEKR